nr:serine/threonine-protein kinase TNNI3K-like isoform X2 [Halyomorpha halys]
MRTIWQIGTVVWTQKLRRFSGAYSSSYAMSQIDGLRKKSNDGHGSKNLHNKKLSSKKVNKGSKKKNVSIMQSEASISSHSWQSVTESVPAVPQRPNRLAAMLAITGADLNSRDGAGLTPLHTAVIWGRLDLCQLLLDSGADPNSTDSLGRTPLQLSTQHGYGSVSSLLISRGGR